VISPVRSRDRGGRKKQVQSARMKNVCKCITITGLITYVNVLMWLKYIYIRFSSSRFVPAFSVLSLLALSIFALAPPHSMRIWCLTPTLPLVEANIHRRCTQLIGITLITRICYHYLSSLYFHHTCRRDFIETVGTFRPLIGSKCYQSRSSCFTSAEALVA